MIYSRACSKLYFIADRVESAVLVSAKRRKRRKNIAVIIRRFSFNTCSRKTRVPKSIAERVRIPSENIASSVFSLPHPIPRWNSIKAELKDSGCSACGAASTTTTTPLYNYSLASPTESNYDRVLKKCSRRNSPTRQLHSHPNLFALLLFELFTRD